MLTLKSTITHNQDRSERAPAQGNSPKDGSPRGSGPRDNRSRGNGPLTARLPMSCLWPQVAAGVAGGPRGPRRRGLPSPYAGSVHGGPGHLNRQCGATTYEDRPRPLDRWAAVGRQRLHPYLRRPAHAGRTSSRPVRPAPGFPPRHRAVHLLQPARRAGAKRGVAHYGPSPSRCGGGRPRTGNFEPADTRSLARRSAAGHSGRGPPRPRAARL